MPPVIFAGSESSGVSVPRVNFVAIAILAGSAAAGAFAWRSTGSVVPPAAMLAVGLVLMQAPRVAQQWERAVVLRLGRFVGLRGPGLFWLVPFVDRVTAWIDQRTITTSFAAEQTLTSDTVPVNVDAVLFWMVHDVAEGRARSAGLLTGRELGRADRAARHHRAHDARRSAAGPRAD